MTPPRQPQAIVRNDEPVKELESLLDRHAQTIQNSDWDTTAELGRQIERCLQTLGNRSGIDQNDARRINEKYRRIVLSLMQKKTDVAAELAAGRLRKNMKKAYLGRNV
jgi:hypothetical protein